MQQVRYLKVDLLFTFSTPSLMRQPAVRRPLGLVRCTIMMRKTLPIPAAARSTAWVCGRSLAGIGGSNPAWGMDVCLLRVLCVVQVEASATG
jgi:hypothetical protein